MTVSEFALVAWAASVAFGAMLGSMRGNVAFGVLWPFVLGPLGLLLAWWLLREAEDPSRL